MLNLRGVDAVGCLPLRNSSPLAVHILRRLGIPSQRLQIGTLTGGSSYKQLRPLSTSSNNSMVQWKMVCLQQKLLLFQDGYSLNHGAVEGLFIGVLRVASTNLWLEKGITFGLRFGFQFFFAAEKIYHSA